MIKQGEKPNFGQDLRSDRLKYQRIARITRVDYEEGFLDLEWLDGFGERTKIPISSAFSTMRGTINGMPEENTLVVCGWLRQTQTLENPVILSYLNVNVKNANEYRFFRDKGSNSLTDINSIREKIGYNAVRTKRRKLYPGEIQAESTQGAELYLDDNVYLSNNKLNEIEIVSSDQSIRISARQNYINTAASRIWNGMITREPNQGAQLMQPTVLSNGQKIQIVTTGNTPYHLGGEAFTEYRIELQETSKGTVPVNEINSGFDISPTSAYVSLTLGTTVGNEKSNIAKYSKILRPQVFSLPNSVEPKTDELECLPEEVNSLPSAFQLKIHKPNTFISIDKQGHLFTNIAASSGVHPLGSGRSWEANFDGSVKWTVGANTKDVQSIILDTVGSIKETLGIQTSNKRSKETIARGGIYTQVLAPDFEGYGYKIYTIGSMKVHVEGNYEVETTGNYTITVNGKITENVLGTKIENYINDKNNVYGGNLKNVIIKDFGETIGGTRSETISGISVPPLVGPAQTADDLKIINGSKRTTLLFGDVIELLTLGNKLETLTLGNKTVTLVAGNLTETLTLGNKTVTLTAGNLTETIVTGNKTTTVTTGNMTDTVITGNKTTTVTAGNITTTAAAGQITTTSATNLISLTALLTMALKSGIKISADALQVSLGMIPARGGVITGMPGIPSHLDYLTGLPLIGSTSVSASI